MTGLRFPIVKVLVGLYPWAVREGGGPAKGVLYDTRCGYRVAVAYLALSASVPAGVRPMGGDVSLVVPSR